MSHSTKRSQTSTGNETASPEIENFYGWVREYWAELGVSPEGKRSHVLNFGLWYPETRSLHEAHENLREAITARLNDLSGTVKGLDIGCGIGGFAVEIAKEKSVQLTCLDLLEEHLVVAAEFARQEGVDSLIDFKQGSAMLMPLADNSFDFAYCIESSFHYTEKLKFFKEVYRVLKDKGIFVFADITCEDYSLITFKSGNAFPSSAELRGYIDGARFTVLQRVDIGKSVFVPVRDYVKKHNMGRRGKINKYWDLVLNNYANLTLQNKMGYEIYKLAKL